MKGQISTLTSIAGAMLILGIVLGLAALMLSTFQNTGAPSQLKDVTNSTTTVNEVAYAQVADVYVDFANPGQYGSFINGTLSIVINGTSATTANTTVKVNGNTPNSGSTYPQGGYNTSGTKIIYLTAALLANGKNNVSYYSSNTSDVSTTTISFAYYTPGGVQTRSTVGNVITTVGNITDWLPIIIIVVIIGIVLGVLGMTGMMGHREG